VPNIVGFGRACELAEHFDGHAEVRSLRDHLEDEVLARFPSAALNGAVERDRRLPNTSNISFSGHDGGDIAGRLDAAGICVSTGSACHSGSAEISAVLRAMKVSLELGRGSIRFSVGRYNTAAEIESVLLALENIVGDSASHRSA
jgi:cysteine desulfurase